jgi:hypothetical protein
MQLRTIKMLMCRYFPRRALRRCRQPPRFQLHVWSSQCGARVSRDLTLAWFTGARWCVVKGVAHASVASWKRARRAGPTVGVARAPWPCRCPCRLRDVVGRRDVRFPDPRANRARRDGGRRLARAGRAVIGDPAGARRSERTLQPQLRPHARRAPSRPADTHVERRGGGADRTRHRRA